MDDSDQLAFDAGIFAAAADRYLENRYYSTLLREHSDQLTRELLDTWKAEVALLGMPRYAMEPSGEELSLLPQIVELSDKMKSAPSVHPWPNHQDRIAWEAYRLTDRGKDLPPYDEAGDALQRIWYGMLRLTNEDIAEVCRDVLKRIKQ